ncbi:hypothetical protein [Erwinia sp. 198]|uniref:hypothetical protein n=1 Tax=Erwinia sp. 198 TaxID=2022746 RepID=UPI000F674509|nr:hypothetical protein [Erwinia sp. 198]RRZ89342.1 hypothetical protein EGK14_15905 [Erwinia sp. 198]
MSRTGFIGLNGLSESIITAIFRTVPEMQVFLYPFDCDRVQKLATAYPCWTLDDCQSVSDESEIIILSTPLIDLDSIAKSMKLRNTHTVVSLIPDASVQQLRLFFPHADCVRMTMISHGKNIKPMMILTGNNQKLEHFLCQAEFLFTAISENQFNLILTLTG